MSSSSLQSLGSQKMGRAGFAPPVFFVGSFFGNRLIGSRVSMTIYFRSKNFRFLKLLNVLLQNGWKQVNPHDSSSLYFCLTRGRSLPDILRLFFFLGGGLGLALGRSV